MLTAPIENHMFVLACYFNRQSPVIFDAVRSIRQYHPDSKIVVVDSGSQDKSYFEELEEFDVIIEDIDNKHYDAGAYWYCYKKYIEIEYFYFLHDSINLKSNLFDLMERDFTSIRYFNSIRKVGGFYLINKRSDLLKKYFLSRLHLVQLERELIGFDSQEQMEWVEAKLKQTRYFFPTVWTSIFGPMMAVHRKVLETMQQKGLDTVLPENKSEQMAMERIFGIALMQEGYDVSDSLQGEHTAVDLATERFEKILLRRG